MGESLYQFLESIGLPVSIASVKICGECRKYIEDEDYPALFGVCNKKSKSVAFNHKCDVD